jgi:hypothetical protein
MINKKNGGENPAVFFVTVDRYRLDVVVQFKLERYRTHPDRIDFCVGLVFDPLLDYVGSKDITLEEEVMVFGKTLESFFQSARS